MLKRGVSLLMLCFASLLSASCQSGPSSLSPAHCQAGRTCVVKGTLEIVTGQGAIIRDSTGCIVLSLPDGMSADVWNNREVLVSGEVQGRSTGACALGLSVQRLRPA